MLQTKLMESVQDVGGGIMDMFPRVIAAFVFVVLGFVFGTAVGRVLEQLVRGAKADEWLTKAGVDRYLAKAGYKLNSGAFVGWLAQMFFVVVFLVVAFDVLQLPQINAYLVQVLSYIPNVVVAVLMIFFASIASEFLSSLVVGTSTALGSNVSNLLGTVTRYAIWIFAIMFALSQLGIAAQYMNILFTGFVAMLALAGGLAFGLGGKEAAGRFIADIQDEMKEGK